MIASEPFYDGGKRKKGIADICLFVCLFKPDDIVVSFKFEDDEHLVDGMNAINPVDCGEYLLDGWMDGFFLAVKGSGLVWSTSYIEKKKMK